jgi:hypothetical protein
MTAYESANTRESELISEKSRYSARVCCGYASVHRTPLGASRGAQTCALS